MVKGWNPVVPNCCFTFGYIHLPFLLAFISLQVESVSKGQEFFSWTELISEGHNKLTNI